MRKLSILMALMLLVSVGGVYATWSYAGTNDIADVLAEAKVTITDIKLEGANGTYTIESNLVLTVDQADENHKAKLVFGSNNDKPIFLKVTFKPATNAPQDIKNNAVLTELYYGVSTDMRYKMDGDGNYSETGTPTDIFKFTNPSDGILNNTITWTKEDDGSFTYTMDQAALEAQIALSQDFVLDTKAEHDAFRAALAGNIVVRVTDGTVN